MLNSFAGGKSNSVTYGGGTTLYNEIRYSQSSVNGSNDIIQSMRESGWKGEPIDVVEMPDGIYTTIDNTRVVSDARTDDGNAEGECFHECGQSYGIGEVQAADHDTTFACHQFPQFVGNHSVGIMDANGGGQCIRVDDLFIVDVTA